MVDTEIASPWPGPRPFVVKERRLLFSRDDELRAISDVLKVKRLLQISAPSGAGKTSFLQAKLVPTLARVGFLPLMFRTWGGSGGLGDTGDHLYCRAVETSARRMTGLDEPLPSWRGENPVGYLTSLQQASPSDRRLLLVFDQLEELLRGDLYLGREFIDTVINVARSNDVIQVVSLRDEYVAELRTIYEGVPHLAHWLRLSEIGPSAWPARPGGSDIPADQERAARDRSRVSDIIRRPPMEKPFGVTIPDDSVDRILDWWSAARTAQRAYPGQATSGPADVRSARSLGATGVGLLHLQALLWSVYRFWADPSDPHRARRIDGDRKQITVRDLDEFADRWGAPSGAQLITDALSGWVDQAIELGESAGRDLNPILVEVAARMGPHLSTGGFKIAREAVQLADLCIGPDLDMLGLEPERLAAVLPACMDGLGKPEDNGSRDLVNRIESTRHLINPMLRVASGIPAKGRVAGSAYLRYADELRSETDDPEALSIKVRSAAATELLLAFGAALAKLEAAHVLRQPKGLGGVRLIELVHDGFGPAVQRWSVERTGSPAAAVRSLTARSGDDLLWTEFGPADIGQDRVAGLCWRGCWIGASGSDRLHLHDVVFDDCDFSGSIFSGVDFERVRFFDCSLAGVFFRDSTFHRVEIEGNLSGVTFGHCAGTSGHDLAGTHTETSTTPDLSNMTITNSAATGLVFDGCAGGPWTVAGSTILHGLVAFEREQTVNCLRVEGSVLRHWHFEHDVAADVSITNSVMLFTTADAPVKGGEYITLHDCTVVGTNLPGCIRTSSGITMLDPPGLDDNPPTLDPNPDGSNPWQAGRPLR